MADQALLNKVFVSYSWDDERDQQAKDIEPIVDQLETACKVRNIELVRDCNEVGYRESLRDYMQSLARGRCVILVLSPGYFESKYCMRELTWIRERGEFLQRVFPLVLSGFRLDDADFIEKRVSYWEQRAKREEDRLDGKVLPNRQPLVAAKDECQGFANSVAELIALIGDMNHRTEDWHRDSDFSDLLDSIEADLQRASRTAEEQKAAEAAEMARMAKSAADELRARVEQEVRTLLEHDNLKLLADKLGARLKNDKHSRWTDPTSALCGSDMDPRRAIKVYLHYATRDCVGPNSNRQLWEGALSVFGWLLLLTLRPSNLGEMRSMLDTRADLRLEIPLATDEGIEVVTAWLSSRHARVHSCRDQRGRDWIRSATVPDGGCFSEDSLNELKADLWVALRLAERFDDRETFIDEDDQRLKDALKEALEAHDYRFLVVPANDDSDAIAALQHNLDQVLPGLFPLYVGCDSNHNLLLLRNENHLRDIVNAFLSLATKFDEH